MFLGDCVLENDLKKLQLTMLDMLKLFDKMCRENDINYSLCSGTLLGAVRHKGFIPWDDDLDIRMTRENYDKFLQIWDTVNHEGYSLQNKENTPNFPQSFTKIRKDETAFIQFEWEKGAYNTGVFIDIFPIDRVPSGKLSKIIFYFRTYKYLIYTRENLHSEESGLVKKAVAFLMKLTSHKHRMQYRKKYVEKLKVLDKKSALNCICIEMPSMLKKEFPQDVADEYLELEFEDCKFMCFKKWHEFLSVMFGDYMTLPPEEERTWQHHPLVLDFEHSWEEIIAQKS